MLPPAKKAGRDHVHLPLSRDGVFRRPPTRRNVRASNGQRIRTGLACFRRRLRTSINHALALVRDSFLAVHGKRFTCSSRRSREA